MPNWIWESKNWPAFTWENSKIMLLLVEARKQQGKLSGARAFFAQDDALEIFIKLFVDESVNTSSIEGEKVNPTAVRSSLSKRLGLKNFGLAKSSEHV